MKLGTKSGMDFLRQVTSQLAINALIATNEVQLGRAAI